MTAYPKKLLFINKKDDISLIFKDIICFQSSSRTFSPIRQSNLIPLEAFRYKRGTNPQNSINCAL